MAVLSIVLPMTIWPSVADTFKPHGNFKIELERECSLTKDHFTRLAEGEIVLVPLRSGDKKEVSICGVARLARGTIPSIDELRKSLSQEANTSILTRGVFGTPATRSDLRMLKIESVDLDSLRKCKPGKCSILVSDDLLQALASRSDWQDEDLQDLYMEDLTEFVSSYRSRGVDAMKSFASLSVGTSLYEQNRSLITNVPTLAALDPAITKYLTEFPRVALNGAETRVGWSKVNFGLKPIVTITSTTFYSTADGFPVVITHQIYSSRYMNGSVAVAAVVLVEDGSLDLIFADITRSDALGGLFSGIMRDVVTTEGERRARKLLDSVRSQLDSPKHVPATAAPESSAQNTFWVWFKPVSAILITAGVISILAVFLRSFRKFRHRGRVS
jgi:hypothetical protein